MSNFNVYVSWAAIRDYLRVRWMWQCGVERSESGKEIAYADGYDERNQKFDVK